MTPILRRDITRIAIIGGGPAGIAAAKYLLAEGTFGTIDVFEQLASAGGTWNYFPDPEPTLLAVPQTSSPWHSSPPQDQLDREVDNDHVQKNRPFVTAMYDNLETNIPHPLMRFSDLPFPPRTPLFPGRAAVLRYLEEYAREVAHLVHFNTQALDVRAADVEEGQHHHQAWRVTTRNVETKIEQSGMYDAVIVASGHYDVPYIPDISGIAAWNQKYPGVISHSKYYRTSNRFVGQKVVIVGNSASGSDISFHVSQVCRSPLIISRRKISSFPTLPEASKVECPEIAEFVLDRRALCFADGRIEEDIDAVIFCTGYLYSYPFLASLRPPVVGDGTRVQNLYKHVFYIPRPTLAFVALPQKVVPFPVSESQAAVIARVWAGRLTLPSAELMEDWEKQTLAAAGGGKTFHYMNFPRDADYMQEFYAWSLQSLPEQPPSCVGKLPPLWGDKERWVRSQIPAIKQAYIAMGEGRHHVWDMEALGFNYEIA